ncbi:hypothetical protein HIM_09409 [Hirsutella minnesotensis 3608]|uniref:HMG box domain-containing protein n=1 Tax=Hirsutella minnesotensis 3608 TaxID=1043627 RepID=A0A0F7ZSE1_9HYPO|nr:hypothetical protein HIM_09409 [Hirsutella minnesotensis 3608]
MGPHPPSPAPSNSQATFAHSTAMASPMPRSRQFLGGAELNHTFVPDYARYHAGITPDSLMAYGSELDEHCQSVGHSKADAPIDGLYSIGEEQACRLSYVNAPFTPEMSPQVLATAPPSSGPGMSKRLRSTDSRREKRGAVEKRRKLMRSATTATSLKKPVALTNPLSEIIKAAGGSEVFDVYTHVHRSGDCRKEEALKEGKVKRPLNAFLLYRKHVILFVKNQMLSEENKNNQQLVSRICGDSWKLETEEVKSKFKKLAHVEKTRHSQAFPMYKYTPKPGKKPDGDDSRAVEQSASARTPASSTPGPRSVMTSSQTAPMGSPYNFGARSGMMAMSNLAHQRPYGDDSYYGYSNSRAVAVLYGQGQLPFPALNDSCAPSDLRYGWDQREVAAMGDHLAEPRLLAEVQSGLNPPGMATASSQLYIDPSLLPGAGEAGYAWLSRDDTTQGQQEWQPCGESGEDMLVMMPDLDANAPGGGEPLQ